jgi:hypothetical protein
MYGYMRLIIMKSLPISYVEDSEICAFSVYNHLISRKRKIFKEVLFKVVELVKESITEEVAATQCGSIVHNGWTCNGTHYIGLFAAYCRPIKVKNKTSFNTESKLELTLLACSPMDNIEQEYGFPNLDEDIAETTKFNAETHVHFFKDMLSLYKLSIKSWVVCSIADNSSTNKKIT